MSSSLPDPNDPETDKVYFAHVIGYYFKTVLFDPVCFLEHVDAISFDYAECILPSESCNIISSEESDTMSYEEIAKFCGGCEKDDYMEIFLGYEDEKDNEMLDNSVNKENVYKSTNGISGESVVARKRQRKRESIISSVDSSSIRNTSNNPENAAKASIKKKKLSRDSAK